MNDGFGCTVALVDINRNGHAGLAASAPGEDTGNGAARVLRGRPTGLVTDAAPVFGGKAVGAPYTKAESGFALKWRDRTSAEKILSRNVSERVEPGVSRSTHG
ncbi:FG-GAP repeat protein [Streptomyces sp. NPDC020362]|uniref:FG-GAP repeat protein n=1 Tax=unclassified Streptomyces TaxID=2593676 RepID=UPI000AF852B0